MKFNPSHQSYGTMTESAGMTKFRARMKKRAEAAERLQAIACGSRGNPPCPVDLPPIPVDATPDPWAAKRRKYQQEWGAYLETMVELPDGQWNPPPPPPKPPTESHYRYSLGDRMTKKQWMLIGGIVLVIAWDPLKAIWRSK